MERTLQKAVTERLETLEKLGKLFYIRVNSGKIRKGNRFIQLAKKGTSDFIIFTKKTCLFVELKDVGEKQNDDQLLFEQKIKRLNYSYFCVDALTAFDDLLFKHL